MRTGSRCSNGCGASRRASMSTSTPSTSWNQILEMSAQNIEIPDRAFRKAVVSDQDCPLLAWAQAGNCDGRDFAHAKPLCRFESAVTCKNNCAFVDEDRIGPDLTDALHQTDDLALRMPARIPRKWLQVVDCMPDDSFRHAAEQPPLWFVEACAPAVRLGLGQLGHDRPHPQSTCPKAVSSQGCG